MITEPKYYAEVIKNPQSFSENTTGCPRERQPSGLFFFWYVINVSVKETPSGNRVSLRNLTGETFELTVYASGCAVSAASTLVQKGPVRPLPQGLGNETDPTFGKRKRGIEPRVEREEFFGNKKQLPKFDFRVETSQKNCERDVENMYVFSCFVWYIAEKLTHGMVLLKIHHPQKWVF